MKPLDLQVSWPPLPEGSVDALDATFGSLRVLARGDNFTAYVDDASGGEHDHVEQPLYDVAEWIADNWWPLTWEPRKSEEKDEPGFRSRHVLTTAQHGFALPSLQIVPTGQDIAVSVEPRHADYADVRFTACGAHVLSRESVEEALEHFVGEVTGRLPEGVGEPLKTSWALVQNTADDARDFCRLIGALGLSPYGENHRIEAALDRISDVLSREQLFDLCLTTRAEDFVRAAHVAERIHAAVDLSPAVDLRPIGAVSAPADDPREPAWQRGVEVAHRVREALGISEASLVGSDKAFEAMNFDWRAKADVDLKGFASPVVGATARRGDSGRLACVHEAASGRHFASARALYFFATGARDERRFITNAVTREQQSSRAFAAELLVPKSYIRAQSHKSSINRDQLHAIAEQAQVAYELVKFQATNDGLKVAA